MSRSPHEPAGPRIRTHSLPAAGFDPRTALPLDLRRYGLPQRPDPFRHRWHWHARCGIEKHHQAPVGKRSGWPCNRPGIDQVGPWGPPGAKNSLAPLELNAFHRDAEISRI
jgi:hypothetical protein